MTWTSSSDLYATFVAEVYLLACQCLDVLPLWLLQYTTRSSQPLLPLCWYIFSGDHHSFNSSSHRSVPFLFSDAIARRVKIVDTLHIPSLLSYLNREFQCNKMIYMRRRSIHITDIRQSPSNWHRQSRRRPCVKVAKRMATMISHLSNQKKKPGTISWIGLIIVNLTYCPNTQVTLILASCDLKVFSDRSVGTPTLTGYVFLVIGKCSFFNEFFWGNKKITSQKV